ncbi:hypothetical protein IFM89_032750 [Coptis chinensis]|uniref:pectinesterase n=1 Tax=Coptis chinensis TaxID=261450 RepID=A0A835HH16_9MAGN|nr:hypothetical protein IFM89_032750 [Coptis chinensis]
MCREIKLPFWVADSSVTKTPYWPTKGRHFFKECFIQGSVDFIYGNGRSLFEDCILNVVAQKSQSVNAIITAHGRTSLKENTGFSFVNCKITGTGNAWLGRAWHPFATVVFINANMSGLVSKKGWNDFGNRSSEKTVFFGEYGCYGEGASHSERVKYSKQLTLDKATPFMNTSYIEGETWLPIHT